MKNTPQFEILTGHVAYFKRVNGQADCFPNPFYKGSVDYVKRYMEDAVEVYKYVFKGFIVTWYGQYQRGENKCIPPKEWEVLKV